MMFNSSQIDKDDLGQASKQLWALLEEKIKYLSKEDRKIVELAFTQMVVAHGEDRRKSGEFYIIHPVAACMILADLEMDKDSLAACLLHDVPEDTKVTLEDLSKDFSAEIVFLVEGVTKLSVIKYKEDDRYSENLRRMFVAMSQDLRVIFIKLADRLHNLRTLKHVDRSKQRRIALESLEIYAPIAERLGISYFRGEIEDAAFQYVYPDEYKKLIHDSDLEIGKRTKQLEKIQKKTEKILAGNGTNIKLVVGRAKKYYSLFRKLREKAKDINEVYDLVALRIVTDTVENCYTILALLHKEFEPLEDRVKDYIAKPKSNGYQSIHTTVKDPRSGIIFEFQIRTEEMNDYAEYGMAAHWSYKSKKGDYLERMIKPESFEWLSNLVNLGTQKWTEEEYLKHVKLDVFHDRIFVFTPKDDPIDLPAGATALDFAFKIHQHIGEHASMAKVNGEIKKLSQQLHNGDKVEILVNKNQKPKLEWLDWVKANASLKHIRSFLKKEKREEKEK